MTPGPEPAAAYPPPRPADDHDPGFTLGLVFATADAPSKHGYPRPDHTDGAELMPALFGFPYQPSRPEQKGRHQ